MPTEQSVRWTTTPSFKVATLLLLWLTVLLLVSCSTVSPVSPPVARPIPEALRTTASEPSATYSEKVRLWLLKVQTTLTSFEPAPKP